MIQLVRRIEDVQTDVLVQSFADRVLVLITQLGKVGNLIQASIPPTAPLLPSRSSSLPAGPEMDGDDRPHTPPLPPPPPSIHLTPLLGSAGSEPLHALYASQAAMLVWLAEEAAGGVSRRPVVVGVALRRRAGEGRGEEMEGHRATFMGVMDMVKELVGKKV